MLKKEETQGRAGCLEMAILSLAAGVGGEVGCVKAFEDKERETCRKEIVVDGYLDEGVLRLNRVPTIPRHGITRADAFSGSGIAREVEAWEDSSRIRALSVKGRQGRCDSVVGPQSHFPVSLLGLWPW